MGDDRAAQAATRPVLSLVLARPEPAADLTPEQTPAQPPDRVPDGGEAVAAATGSLPQALVAAPSIAAAMPQAPRGVRYIPGEDVLLCPVRLPPMSAAQRRSATRFAIEDDIAQPLAEVHVVAGPELSPGVWLVAVAAHGVLAQLVGTVQPGSDRTRWLPDPLALPVPDDGWAVWAGPTRVLVRQAGGGGFATTPAELALYWTAAGRPAVTLMGGVLPDAVPMAKRGIMPTQADPALATFDLRPRGGAQDSVLPPGLRRIAAVVLVALAGHVALMAADVVALVRLAAQRQSDLRNALTAVGQPATLDIDAALALALAAAPTGAEPGGFLPLAVRSFAALAPEAGRITLQDLRYSAPQGELAMTLETPDLATLQRAETALGGVAGQVTVGAATTGAGGAQARFTLREAVQ